MPREGNWVRPKRNANLLPSVVSQLPPFLTQVNMCELTSYYEGIYRNTIAHSLPSEGIFIYLKKNKVRLSKIEYVNFCFFSKKSVKMTLNSLEVTKCCKNYFIIFFCFMSSEYSFFYVIYLF
jgi:hypothetical protein